MKKIILLTITCAGHIFLFAGDLVVVDCPENYEVCIDTGREAWIHPYAIQKYDSKEKDPRRFFHLRSQLQKFRIIVRPHLTTEERYSRCSDWISLDPTQNHKCRMTIRSTCCIGSKHDHTEYELH